MDDLLLSSQTRLQLNALLGDTPHAILFVGATGMGKKTIATRFAGQLTSPELITIVEPDEKGTIGISSIRELYAYTRNRQDGRQVIIIDHAEGMGVDAQNALLKLLEEPRAGVTFILTAPTNDTLLPTIRSRVQGIEFPRIAAPLLRGIIAQKAADMSPQTMAQLLFIADGRPGVAMQLLGNPDELTRRAGLMKQAKEMLSATPYERLSKITDLTKNKDDAITLLEAMARMLQLQLPNNPTDQWLHAADSLQICLQRLAQNGNLRAQLTALFARL